MKLTYSIRKTVEEDAGSIASIFNYFVENSFASYETMKAGPDFYSKLRRASVDLPFYVVESAESRKVVGFGFLQPYRNRDTFRQTAEISYFILPEHTRRGLGTELLKRLEKDARENNITTLLANISSLNEQSLRFHRKNGFKRCGSFKRIGTKFGKEFDVIWMQKFLVVNQSSG
ncbi:MAG: GNAT family N-acetyltransferase [Candidatus Bathyarchaeota archaeon]|nr:GNAT family N-acetyltransferase [Candidatus Bathyarchaeota archaeon]MDH5787877.1 GNAT family N-acetyltransferase [Candidatus Bathyarchaeota archaeon]